MNDTRRILALGQLVPLDVARVAVCGGAPRLPKNALVSTGSRENATDVHVSSGPAILLADVVGKPWNQDPSLESVDRLGDRGVLLLAIECRHHRQPELCTDLAAYLECRGLTRVDVLPVLTRHRIPRAVALPGLVLVRAWRQQSSREHRVHELLKWTYRALHPGGSGRIRDPLAILRSQRALCWGYAAVLAEALLREQFPFRRITMIARDHPGGRGREKWETHEVVEVCNGSEVCVADPTTGALFPHSLDALLQDPTLARVDGPPDERWMSRRYELYASEFFYSRVAQVGIWQSPHLPPRFVSAARVANEPLSRQKIPWVDYRPPPRVVTDAVWWWKSSLFRMNQARASFRAAPYTTRSAKAGT